VVRKFGQAYANALCQRCPKPGDKWHLDEVFLTIMGERYYLWRAVDQDGNVLDILVQSRRSEYASALTERPVLRCYVFELGVGLLYVVLLM
jgi:putative transposase